MTIWTDILRPVVAAVSISVLAGCATTQEDLIPQDGPDMLDIYRSHMSQTAQPAPAEAGIRRQPGASGETAPDTRWSRDAVTEIDNRFPLLPNPWLVLYIYPHLAEDGAPVPGYTTAFRMYARDEFALPGEIAAP